MNDYLQHGRRHGRFGTDPIPGGFVVDRCAHYDTLTVPAVGSGGQHQVTWGPIGGGFDFEHGSPIFDYSNVHSPVVLNDGWYTTAVWVNLTTGQGSFSEFAQLAVDFDTAGDDNDLVGVFPLLGSGYGTGVITVPPCFMAAGSGFDANVRHPHTSSLNYQSFVFTQRLA